MLEITMMPMPRGRWMMTCPCGATEIRATTGPRWTRFTLRRLGHDGYRITCLTCHRATEHTAQRRLG